jgi:hypothetical protein
MPIKTLIAGLGNIGMMYDYSSNKIITHCKYISKNKYFTLSGAVDKKLLNRKKFIIKYRKPAFKNTFEALKKINPQLIIIAYYEKKIENIKKIIKYPSIKHIIVEKPFLYKIEEVKNFFKFLNKNKKTFLINFPRSFNHKYKKIQKLIEEKKFGKIKCIEFSTSGDVISNFSHFLFLILNKIPIKFKINYLRNIIKIDLKKYYLIVKKIKAKYFFFNFKLYFEKGIVLIEGPPEKIKIYSINKRSIYKGIKSLKIEKKINLGIVKNGLYKKIQSKNKKIFILDKNKFINYTKILRKIKI